MNFELNAAIGYPGKKMRVFSYEIISNVYEHLWMWRHLVAIRLLLSKYLLRLSFIMIGVVNFTSQ